MQSSKVIPIYDTAQRGPVALEELREVLRYRDLIVLMVRRDIVTRYKRSVLGVIWTMLHPLGMMLVLTIVFSQLFGTTRAFSAYLLSGLIAWTFFSQTTSAAISNLVWGGSLLQRIYIPPTAFAISAIGTGLVNLALSLVPLVVVMLASSVPLRPTVLFLPVPTLLLACFAMGVGLLISTFAVFFPDVAEIYQIVLIAWMYLSPVVYPEEILSPICRLWLLRLNPMYHLVRLFRMPIYDGRLPSWAELWPASVVSLLALILGWLIVTKKSEEFAYRV